MRNKFVLFLIVSMFAIATFAVSAQDTTSAKKLELANGVAKVIGQQKIVLETKAGMLDAVLGESTTYFRLPPDNLKISAATDSKLADITISDNVLVTGTFSADRKTIYAVKVYLVKGSDIAKQQEEQRQEWRTRGIKGRVNEVDATAKTITVEMRSITGADTTLQITPKDEIKYLRYSADSVKYNDALKSDFSTIQKDDMLQALGDKSEDGTTFKAEEILTGAFITVAGTVKSVDTEKNEVVVTDLKTKKDITIVVKDSSLLKKFPEGVAQRMARIQAMMQGGGGGGVRPPNGGGDGARQGRRGQRGGGDATGLGRGGGRGGDGEGRGGGMDINQMLNNFPTITVGDLTAGEMIAVSSPKGNDATRLTAIKLLAGVEPFVTMAAASGGGRSGGGGRGGVSGGLNIPGLDATDF